MASTTDSTTNPPDGSSESELPLGTSPEYSRMHTYIRRICYVLLFGLVIEGALTFPLLAMWYGFPELSPIEVCSELQKEMYADDTRECETPYSVFPGPPLGGPSEAEGQTTSEDIWGIQPVPGNDRIEFRELVENHNAREAQENGNDDEGAAPDDDAEARATTTTTPG